MMKKATCRHFVVLAGVLAMALLRAGMVAAQNSEDWRGSWAFELPDGNPAWLRIGGDGEALEGDLLWSVGSAQPVTELSVDGATLRFRRKLQWRPFGDAAVKLIHEPMTATIDDNGMLLTFSQTEQNELGEPEVVTIRGRRMPPMPSPPNLAAVRFGEPSVLFNGRDLSGWRLSNPRKLNGWRAENGVLINETSKTDFGAYGDHGNLRTDQVFHDFQLTLEYNVAGGGNSGVYLRGMYEAQVVDRDSRMQGIQGPGAIFGRIAPARNAGLPGGQWNRYELTLVERHVTVVLNGEKVIDNAPVIGCTGGGISADDTRPGPILLQGDHTSVQYRNIVIRSVER